MCPGCTGYVEGANSSCSSDAVECEAPNQIYAPTCNPNDCVLPDPINPQNYYDCVKIIKGYFYVEHIDCPDNFLYDETTGFCSTLDSSYTPPKSCGSQGPHGKFLSSSNYDCIATKESPVRPMYYDTPCPAPGIYPYALDCSRYVICSQDTCSNSITKTIQNCPPTKLYDINKSTCENMEHCKCLCTSREPVFNCTEIGNFPDSDCPSQYYVCSEQYDIMYTPKRKECISGTIFDVEKRVCTNNTSPGGLTTSSPDGGDTDTPPHSSSEISAIGSSWEVSSSGKIYLL